VAASGSERFTKKAGPKLSSFFTHDFQGAVAVGLHLRLGDSALSNARKKKDGRYPPECVLPAPCWKHFAPILLISLLRVD